MFHVERLFINAGLQFSVVSLQLQDTFSIQYIVKKIQRMATR